MDNKFNVCLFSGGRGAATILSELVNVEQLKLVVLLNAYDDGLSTGVLRNLIPGMLGPSDIRKTFSTVLKSSNRNRNLPLAELLEYRMGSIDSNGNAWRNRDSGSSIENSFCGDEFLNSYFDNLPLRISRKLISWTNEAFQFLFNSIGEESLREILTDMAFGNILFAGAYLESNKDFNAAIEVWTETFDPGISILNVTNGENRVLFGVKEDGSLLPDEAAIVSKHKALGKIERIFLLKQYLTESENRVLSTLPKVQASAFLLDREVLPEINSSVAVALEKAQMIIYGPGTQHSSLLPSYMTKRIAEQIASNTAAEKVFISNIGMDHDIVGENFDSLMENLEKYMNIGVTASPQIPRNRLITKSMISSFSDLSFDMATFDNSRDLNNEINYAKWGSDNYSHDGVRVSRALMTIASMNSKLFQQESLCSMSIVIPVLNEIPTLAKVLNDVVTFDWLGEGFVPQIIVVDGGSSDGSWEYLKTVNGILALSSADTPGRGSAIRKGIMHARGEVVVTFPADDEYAVDSLIDIGRALVEKDVGIVFGSRSTLCIDTDARLREIYGGRTREYFLSKWGGFLLSSISAVKYHRWISDPLTSIKGFKKNDKMNLSFIGDSLNWDTRIIIDSWKQRVPIMEVAVDYVPRTRRQGKKTTVHSGLMALWELIKSNR